MQQSTLDAAGNLGDPEFGLVQQEQLAFSAKAKVCHSTAHLNLANELSTSIPDVDAIAASRIDIALQIALDAIGNAYITAVSGPTRPVACVHTTTLLTFIRHGKHSSVGYKVRAMPLNHIKRITGNR